MSKQWMHLHGSLSSDQEYAFEVNLLFIPSYLTLFHTAQDREYS